MRLDQDAANSQARQVKLRVHRKDIPTGKAHLLKKAQHMAGKAAPARFSCVISLRSESWWSSKHSESQGTWVKFVST